ncbi:MAG: hypothetical protein QOI10_2922 [Solirubrobacterales bacterium]|jgi:hypothetical protein|nr:hypothetical protein [Solirubrobacterales bacterium]
MDSEQLRAALARTLGEVDADERLGPLIGATRLRMRFEFTDLGMALNVAAADRGHNLTWSFADDPGWPPKLTLMMSSEVANRYLQGAESLAIGIARGQVRWRGDSRTALLYLPAARLIAEPYRRVIEAEYPALAA